MHYAKTSSISRRFERSGTFRTIAAVLLAALLQGACGGGGGGGSSSSGGTSSNGSSAPTTSPSAALPAPSAPALSNEQVVTVDAGPANGVNLLSTSVTICTPGDSSSCQTIDKILVDTGSTGLRLFASVLPAAVRLRQQVANNGGALVECMQFADGFSWGPVKTADLKLGGETIRSMSVQVIADPAFPNIPADCSATGPAQNTVSEFGSNGVIGISNFIEDCGVDCAQAAARGLYYTCSGTGCAPTIVATSAQMKNPVALLSKDNNGVVLKLPAVPQGGARSVSGSMVFGIGTASNNGLGNAKVLTVDPFDGTLVITSNGGRYASSFIDSGSNGIFFPSPGTPVCRSGFYCPTASLTFTGLLQGRNGNNTSISLPIGNADALFAAQPDFGVVPPLGGPAFAPDLIDLGLPFYLGRSVYTAFENRATPGGTGPYVAF